ncbi:MAG TPA: BrnA antitoxin family protein [Burkholderiales bacterium]|nr:BrnA antitoxin family protein [Burkholderiales bacterium]
MKRAITLKSPKTTSNKRFDPDNPLWSEEMLGPPVFKRGRGPQKAPTKILTTVRLDTDVIAFFKAQGRGYQTRINDELRKVVAKDLKSGSKRTRLRRAA